MAKRTKFWIKQRDNPQLGTYYVPMGQMAKADAKKCESPLYGSNSMLSFDTEEDYRAKIAELKLSGERVRD